MTATWAGRTVIVHGPADPALDMVLRGSGLVPVHQAEGAVIWAPPTVPVPDNPSAATPGSGKLLLSIVEAAERLSVGRSTVYELINRGDLEVVHVGRAARVPAEAVADLVNRLRPTAGYEPLGGDCGWRAAEHGDLGRRMSSSRVVGLSNGMVSGTRTRGQLGAAFSGTPEKSGPARPFVRTVVDVGGQGDQPA